VPYGNLRILVLYRSRAEKRGFSNSSQEDEEDKRLKLKATGTVIIATVPYKADSMCGIRTGYRFILNLTNELTS
jgi:hypothetical protein